VIWFTGLSGAGKSTIANIVEKKLHASGAHTYLLDGDNVRHGLSKDLGFTKADRIENIRRIGEVARLMVDAGLIVLVSFISPLREERRLARAMVEDREFCEVYVDTPLAIAEQHDVNRSLPPSPSRGTPKLHRCRLAVRTASTTRGPPRRRGDPARRRRRTSPRPHRRDGVPWAAGVRFLSRQR
jgi:predicted kinase